MANKYGSGRCTIQGISFHSQAEGRYYLILKDRLNKGEISDLILQPTFTIQPSFRKNGRTIRAITYVSDFQYTDSDGNKVVVDVKNPGTVTDVFKIKKKLWDLYNPDIELTMVHSVTFEAMSFEEMMKRYREEKKARKAKRKKK